MERKTQTIDATNKILGRLAADIAFILQGKNKTDYVPYLDTGDDVIVTNISKIHLSGKKKETKKYYHYSGYPGGLKETSYKKLVERDPVEAFRRAVYGMLPKNKLRKKMLNRLELYAQIPTEKKDQN